MPWRIYQAFLMHATVRNGYFLHSSTFFDNLKLFIYSFSQLVELLFLSDITDTISREKLGTASLLHALTVLRSVNLMLCHLYLKVSASLIVFT